MDLAVSTIFNFFFIPSPSYFIFSDAMKGLFPINAPAWSLFWEMIINFAFAAFLFRLSEKWLIAVMGAAGLGLIWAVVVFGGLDVGFEWATWAGAAARVAFGFTVGVLMQRRLNGAAYTVGWVSMIPPVVLLACLVAPVAASYRPIFDLLFCFAIAPAIIVTGALVEVPAFLVLPSRWLGYASYPVYVLHRGIISLYQPLIQYFHVPAYLAVLIIVPAIFAFAVFVSLSVDRMLKKKKLRSASGALRLTTE